MGIKSYIFDTFEIFVVVILISNVYIWYSAFYIILQGVYYTFAYAEMQTILKLFENNSITTTLYFFNITQNKLKLKYDNTCQYSFIVQFYTSYIIYDYYFTAFI